jgi:8-oxo-dGTP pyrophosphatase MutT (NUDIX family)
MDIISRIAKMRGRDPRIATKAVEIIKAAGAQPREYTQQSAALLKWVQDELYYVNEPGERLQDPLYTMKVGYGDCDDLSIMLGALLESIRMPWKLVISGTTKSGKKIRYVQGDKFPKSKGINWSHIYVTIGDRPFKPSKWDYAETTVRGVPLGWDVVDGSSSVLPEMNTYGATMSNYGIALNNAPSPLSANVIPGAVAALAPRWALPQLSPENTGRRAVSWRAPVHQGPAQADMVAILVRRPDGRILVLHRSSDQAWMGGKWDLPGGKTLGLGARDAAAKILAAETGIKIDPRRFENCASMYHPQAGTSAFYKLSLGAGDAEKWALVVNKPEHQGFKWAYAPEVLRDLPNVPYLAVALRACDKPGSLATGFRGHPGSNHAPKAYSPFSHASKAGLRSAAGNALSSFYGDADAEDSYYSKVKDFYMKSYYGVPVWAMGAAAAAYYVYKRK